MGKLFVLLLGLLWAQTDAAWASVFNAKVPGKWPAGQITWYYNPNGRPANLADAEVIAAVSTAFADWQRVCQITPVYGGTTDVPADPPAPSTYVVGWTDFGSPQFHAKGVRSRLGGTATYAPLTGGGIQINTANTDWRSLFDAGSAHLHHVRQPVQHQLLRVDPARRRCCCLCGPLRWQRRFRQNGPAQCRARTRLCRKGQCFVHQTRFRTPHQ